MSEHIQTRRRIKEITEKSTFYDIIDRAMISEREQEIMKLHYIDGKDFGCIADELGYSTAGVIKMHQRVLKKIGKMLW